MSNAIKSKEQPTDPASIIRSKIGQRIYLLVTKTVLDEGFVEELKTITDNCIKHRELEIFADLSKVHKIDSKAIECLLDINDSLYHLGGWLRLTNLTPSLKSIFYITRTSTQLVAVSNEREEEDSLAAEKTKKFTRLGDILVHMGFVTQERVDQAINMQKKFGIRLGQILIDQHWLTESNLLLGLSEQLSIPYASLHSNLLDMHAVKLIDKDTAKRLNCLPLFSIRNLLTVATSDPQAISQHTELEERVGLKVQLVLSEKSSIYKTINDVYEDQGQVDDYVDAVDDDFQVMEDATLKDYEAIDEIAATSPVVNLVNSILQRAVKDGASDIHIEPTRQKSRVRFRIDGVLYQVMSLKPELHPALVSRLKVMANLDISERRMPQDGRVQVHTRGRLVDLRFSSLPSLFGEKIVLRVLDKDQAILDVNNLGMTVKGLQSYKDLLGHSYGLILVTGPTGSGKTTSLYAGLSYLNSTETNILTIEDPAEYQLEGIVQNEVKNNIGLTFAKMLKHILRQDPDIIMVGEIRERETAEIAVQAALTGHLVVSTLHTNDSIGAITRMIDMKVEPYLLSSALIGVVAQRLVRSICNHCKTEFLAPPEVAKRYGWGSDEVVRLAKGKGCAECYDSGYKGRVGIYEFLAMEQDLQSLIMRNPSRDQLVDYLENHAVETLFKNGMKLVKQGITTIEEVSRVVSR